ncbi:hypothetical protein F5X68DRAFT_235563 [Plectosphaerella plurivora]|uniref:Uncharacterized protein n=1 Tax=Plectosphaerella plurivora TaxID=936078 RepID=A0A9P9A8I9_9PEZI|nr:hypothetical protein F5X68DRAFT_235563 [Plectosphaerella plurivora]
MLQNLNLSGANQSQLSRSNSQTGTAGALGLRSNFGSLRGRQATIKTKGTTQKKTPKRPMLPQTWISGDTGMSSQDEPARPPEPPLPHDTQPSSVQREALSDLLSTLNFTAGTQPQTIRQSNRGRRRKSSIASRQEDIAILGGPQPPETSQQPSHDHHRRHSHGHHRQPSRGHRRQTSRDLLRQSGGPLQEMSPTNIQPPWLGEPTPEKKDMDPE